jgi:hypothetical protein
MWTAYDDKTDTATIAVAATQGPVSFRDACEEFTESLACEKKHIYGNIARYFLLARKKRHPKSAHGVPRAMLARARAQAKGCE